MTSATPRSRWWTWKPNRFDSGSGQYVVSDSGTLWYEEGEGTVDSARLIRRARNGGTDLAVFAGGTHTFHLSVSPDGSRLLEQRGVVAGADLWVRDLRRDVSRQLTFDGGYGFPIWTPDGQDVTYAHPSDGRWRIYRRTADGGGEPVLLLEAAAGSSAIPTDWSPDGTTLVFTQWEGDGPSDLYLLRTGPGATPGGVAPEILVGGPGNDAFGRVSPDGRWLAYHSAPAGRTSPEIFVTSFPDARGRWQLSDGGGAFPMWSGDSREVTFVRPAGDRRHAELVSVALDPKEGRLSPAPPRARFEIEMKDFLAPYFRTLSGSPDRDEFFVVAESDRQTGPLRSIMVFGWLDELRRKVPTR